MVAASCTMSTSSDAPTDFDPYQQWLGLSPDQRPYDHYALLGLEPFEGDRQVISTAAQRTMAELRKRRQGDTARDAQRLIAELSQATTCLLNANRKRLYDRHLHQQLDPPAAVSQGPPPVPRQSSAAAAPTLASQVVISQQQTDRTGSVAKTDPRMRQRKLALLAAGIVATVLVMAGIASMLIGGGEADTQGGSQVAAGLPTTTDGSSDPRLPTGSPVAGSTPDESGVDLPPSEFEFPSDVVSPDYVAAQPGPSTPPPSNPATPRPVEVALPPEVPLPFAPSDESPKAIRFAGTDRIALAEPGALVDFAKPFTMEMWVRFDKGAYAHWLMGNLVMGSSHPDVEPGVTAGWQMWIMQTEGGRQRFAVATGVGFWAEYPAVDETWRHLAVAGDGANVAIFVDGRRAASQPVATLTGRYVPSPIPVHLGSHTSMHPTQPAGLQGHLRAVRISSTCRYRENFAPPESIDPDEAAELVFDFRHADSSRRINDLSRHGRHGTLWGAQWLAMPAPAAKPDSTTVAGTPPVPDMPPVPGTVATPEPVLTPAVVPEPAPPARLTPPADAEQQAAVARIRTLLAAEIDAARRPAEQLALAAKLVALAAESSDDRTMQFVLFEMAVERLVKGQDLSKALKVIDDLAVEFDVDRLARRAAAIVAASSGPRDLAQRQTLAETALGAGSELMRAGRFDLAEDVAQVAVASATRARSQELGRQARQLRDQAKRASHLQAEAELARDRLVDLPDDAAANLTYGKFLCLQRSEWSTGAACLAKSGDDAFQPAALAELKADQGAAAQAAAADLWYAARTSIDKADIPALLEHVLQLSRQAAPELKGIAKLEIEQRIEQIARELPDRPNHATPAAAAPRFEPPPEFQSLIGRLQLDGRDAGILWKYRSGLRIAENNVADILQQAGLPKGRVQIDFVGKLNLPETMTVNVVHQGGSPNDATATLYVDGKLVGVLGGEKATSDLYKLELAKGEHTIAWQLAGRNLATNALRFIDAAAATPLVVYHDPLMLNAVRDNPSRARLTVNLVGGAVNN